MRIKFSVYTHNFWKNIQLQIACKYRVTNRKPTENRDRDKGNTQNERNTTSEKM